MFFLKHGVQVVLGSAAAGCLRYAEHPSFQRRYSQ